MAVYETAKKNYEAAMAQYTKDKAKYDAEKEAYDAKVAEKVRTEIENKAAQEQYEKELATYNAAYEKYQTDLAAYKTAKAAYDVKVAEKQQLMQLMQKLKLSMMRKWSLTKQPCLNIRQIRLHMMPL